MGTQTREPLMAEIREHVTEALVSTHPESQLENVAQPPGMEFSAQQSVKAEKWVSSDPAHPRAGVSPPLSCGKTQRTRGRTGGPGCR